MDQKIIVLDAKQELSLRSGQAGRIQLVIADILDQTDNQPEPMSVSQTMRVYTVKGAGGREYQEFLGELYIYRGENQLVMHPEDDEELEYTFTLTNVRDTSVD